MAFSHLLVNNYHLICSYLCLWLPIEIEIVSGTIDLPPCRKVSVQVYIPLIEPPGLVITTCQNVFKEDFKFSIDSP